VTVIDRYPQLLGLGIEDDTGLLVSGEMAQVFGTGCVAIYHNHKYKGSWYCYLNPGDRFNLDARLSDEWSIDGSHVSQKSPRDQPLVPADATSTVPIRTRGFSPGSCRFSHGSRLMFAGYPVKTGVKSPGKIPPITYIFGHFSTSRLKNPVDHGAVAVAAGC
jgi:hypothetical protein